MNPELDDRYSRQRKRKSSAKLKRGNASVAAQDRRIVLEALFAENCGPTTSVRPEWFVLAVLCCLLLKAYPTGKQAQTVCDVYRARREDFENWLYKHKGSDSPYFKHTRAEFILASFHSHLPKKAAELFKIALQEMHEVDEHNNPILDVWMFATSFGSQVIEDDLIDYYRLLSKPR